VQCRDLVVELLAALVEAATSASGNLAHLLQRDERAAILLVAHRLGEIRHHLEHAQSTARIPITAMRQRHQRLVLDVEVAATEATIGVLERAPQ
jgi:hypothetical protein